MIAGANYRTIDIALFIIANAVNIRMIGIMLSRPMGLKRLETASGLVFIALALPVGLAVILNFLGKREWWTVVLPLLLVVFALVELLFDYVLKLDFRSTSLLWPYLLLYFLSLWGMIGYSFLIGRSYGFITLVTYFLNLLATWYSYTRVGHG